MLKIILPLLVLGFLGYVQTKPSDFYFERSAVLKAAPEKIFPYLSTFALSGQWSPYERRDPAMKKTISGTDGAPGAKMAFDGNDEVGAGSVEVTKLVPNSTVELRLLMERPMKVDNQIFYVLTPAPEGTRLSWAMRGRNSFMGKLLATVISVEDMLGKDKEQGFANLRKLVE